MRHPLLSRPYLRSFGSDALFSPYGQYVCVPSLGHSEDGFLNINRGPDAYDQFLEQGVAFHEIVHWYQSHGTTVGIFLNWLRVETQNSVFRHFMGVPPSIRLDLLTRRTNDKSFVILDLDKSGELIYNGPSDPDMEMFANIWHDFLITNGIFSNTQNVIGMRGEFRNSISNSIADLVMADTRCADPTDYKTYRSAFSVVGECNAFPGHEGVGLQVDDLFECAASIAQITWYYEPLKIWSADHPKLYKRFESIVRRFCRSDRYTLPLRMLLAALQMGTIDRLLAMPPNVLHAILLTTSLLIDIALNPAIPPIVSATNPEAYVNDWTTLFPPYRYVKLLFGLRKVGILDSIEDDQKFSNFLTDICIASGVTPPYTYMYNLGEYWAGGMPVEKEGKVDLDTYLLDIYRFISGVMLRERQAAWGAFSMPGTVIPMRMLSLEKSTIRGDFDAVTRPLVWNVDGNVHFYAGSSRTPRIKKMGEQMLDINFAFEYVHKLMCGRGVIKSDAPWHNVPSERTDRIKEEFVQHFAVDELPPFVLNH
jgi:hypothetical protein